MQVALFVALLLPFQPCNTLIRQYFSSYSRIQSLKSIKQNEYIDKIELKSWGPYYNTDITFGSKPGLIIVSGKSGSGKSIMISALEFMIKSIKDFKSHSHYSLITSSNTDTLIRIKKGDSIYHRSIITTGKTRRSEYKIDNKKVTYEIFSNQLPIRLWSRDSLTNFDTSTDKDTTTYHDNILLTYIDDMIYNKTLYLTQLKKIYEKWSSSYKEKQRLTAYQSLTESQILELNNKRFYLTELLSLQSRGREVLGCILDEFENVLSYSDSDNSDSVRTPVNTTLTKPKITTNSGDAVNIHDLKSHILQALSLDNTLDLSLLSTLLVTSETALSQLSSSYNRLAAPDSSINPGSSNNAATSTVTRKPNVVTDKKPLDPKQMNTKLFAALDQYTLNIQVFQSLCQDIGFTSDSPLFQRIVTLQSELLSCKSQLEAALHDWSAYMSSWPDLSPVLKEIHALQQQWATLARKHSCLPGDLPRLMRTWHEDIETVDNLDSLLPQVELSERLSRAEYVKLASHLTQQRREAAVALEQDINKLLPSLEMPDKIIRITHNYLDSGIAGSSGASLTLAEPVPAMAYGMDRFELRVSAMLNSASQTQAQASGIDDATSTYAECGDDEEVVPAVEGNLSSLPFQSLSSGEKSRLSLAIETCILDHQASSDHLSSDAAGSTDSPPLGASSSSSASMVIFDELDAHVGGEAAVSIAKLLKRQSKHRQIVAVTHNPIIAAAADLHLLVNRTTHTVAPGTSDPIGSGMSSVSMITVVTGEERRQELLRMVTGMLSGTSDSGGQLVQSLLEYDYNM